MYYSLRITPELFNCPFGLALGIVKNLLKKHADKDMYIVADEKIDNTGNQTHHHFHFNFLSDYKKDSLQSHIRRWFADRDYKITSPKNSYALSVYNEPDDIDRWWRYCMKEKYIPELTNLSDYTAEQIKTMEICAKDERKITIALNIKAAQKKAEKKTMYDKLEKYLNDNEMNLKTSKQITMCIYKYYMENSHSINIKTIDGYTHLYRLKTKQLSVEEFYDINH